MNLKILNTPNSNHQQKNSFTFAPTETSLSNKENILTPLDQLKSQRKNSSCILNLKKNTQVFVDMIQARTPLHLPDFPFCKPPATETNPKEKLLYNTFRWPVFKIIKMKPMKFFKLKFKF